MRSFKNLFFAFILAVTTMFALAIAACGDTADDGTSDNNIASNNGDNNDGNNGSVNNNTNDGFRATIMALAPTETPSPTYTLDFRPVDECAGLAACEIDVTKPGEHTVLLEQKGWLFVPKTNMLDENGMVMEVTWDNSESPGQYGLAPEGLYQDRDDSSFQVNLKAEIVTDAFTNLPTIVMGYLGDRTIISGNHFTAPDLEQSVIEGTISNDLKTIEVYLVTSAGVEFNRTLIKE